MLTAQLSFFLICVMCLCYLSTHLSWAIFNWKGRLPANTICYPLPLETVKEFKNRCIRLLSPEVSAITSILVLWDSFGFYEHCHFTLVQFTELLLMASFTEANL